MYVLKNEKVRFALDEKGNMTELVNLSTGHNYAGQLGMWRIIFEHEEVLEEEISSEQCSPEVSASENKLVMTYSSMNTVCGKAEFFLEITASLQDDEIHFSAKLRNDSSSWIMREFQFPFVKNISLVPGQEFIWSPLGGEHIKDISGAIDMCHSAYVGQDNKAVEKFQLYPGFCATNSYTFTGENEGLYFGSHDMTFQNTLHLLRKRGTEIDPGMVKYPFLKPGQSVSIDGYVLSPYCGSWHVAAKKYRKWADTWFEYKGAPDSIKNTNGWHRLIMRHQYGKVIFRYDELPRILKSGLEAGIDTIFMFGWFWGGHDANYPEYKFDETQGGRDELYKHIQEFRKGGGKIILYFNGQLIDTSTEFYRTIGKRISVKNPNGGEHLEFYPFGGDGTALRQFGNKSFATACFGCSEWLDHLKSLIDKAIDLDVDGVFFDQMGYISRPCCDPTHGHPVPFHTIVSAKADMLKEMRAYLKSKRPEMSFGIEWFSDITTQHVDFLHNIRGANKAVNDWEHTGEKPEVPVNDKWVRYIFPEVIMSDREIRDDQDIERRVNRALLNGLISDVEIYRCRALIDETPHYKEYLTKANKLRDRYRDIILNGTYIDTDGFSLDNPELSASAFVSGDRMAIMVTQSHLDEAGTVLKVPGYSYQKHDGLNRIEVTGSGDTAQVKVYRHGLAVVFFEKQ